MARETSAGRRIPAKPRSRPAKSTAAPATAVPERPDLPLLRTSERSQFKRCVQRWWWGSVEGLQLAGPPDVKLWFGSGWHEVMAHHYCGPGLKRGKQPLKVWRDYVGEELAKIRVNKQGEDWSHEQYIDARELGEQMIEAYFDKYGNDETWHVIEPEQVGHILIPRPGTKDPMVNYSFTYDLVFRDLETEYMWLGEHKTAKAINANHLDMDDQGGSYYATATHRLRAAKIIGPSERLHGVMYNFVRKAPPDLRERDAEGLVHNKPGKEDYVAAFEEAGVDPDEYSVGRGTAAIKKLEEIASEYGLTVWGKVSANQPVQNFLRVPVTRTRSEVRTQIEKIQNEFLVMEQFRAGNLPLIKTPTRDCSWDCSFKDMCLVHERGGDWQEYRDAVYTHGDPYGPYRKSSETGDK